MSDERLPEWRYIVRRLVVGIAVFATFVWIVDLLGIELCEEAVCELEEQR